MGKNKNKSKNNFSGGSNSQNKLISQGSVNNIFVDAKEPVSKAPANVEADAPINVDGIQQNLDLMAPAANKLSEEEKNEFNKLLDEFKAAVKNYSEAKKKMDEETKKQNDRSEGLDARKEELDNRENDLNNRSKELDGRNQKLANNETAVAEKETAVEKKESEVTKRESEVKKREAEADAGFIAREAQWKEKAIAEFNEKIQSIKDKLESDQKQYNEDKAALVRDQAKCALKLEAYNAKEAAFDEVKKEMKAGYDRALFEKQQDFERRLAQKDNENRRLQNLVAQFEDIRAELGGRSTSEISTMISELKDENSNLRIQMQGMDSVEKQNSIKESLEHYRVKYEATFAEKEGLHNQLSDLRAKVHDVEGYQSQIRTLEIHKKALEEAVKQLDGKVKELSSQNDNKSVFAELVEIDQRCKTEYNHFTVSGGDLKSFVNALGYELTKYTPSLRYTPETLQLFVGGLAMSRLVILQGISGTGKTKLAQAFASIVGDGPHPFRGPEKCSCIVPVQAGWRDNQDLLGYYNAFEKKFYERPFSKGLYAASTPAFKNRLFFLVLDEMNLSHPEQYFADFISGMEQTNSVNDPFKIDLLSGMSDEVMHRANWPLELKNSEKITIPSNVWFVGTANHDETTMEFADKTYDRAHVMVMNGNPSSVNYTEVPSGSAHWSASKLLEAFVNAQNSEGGRKQAQNVMVRLNLLKGILKKEFDVSFGNRLERQVANFVPVVCAAGGSEDLALDHLIATKIVRKGKITGLFGVQQKSLEELRKMIFEILGLGIKSQTITLLDEDIERKKRGA